MRLLFIPAGDRDAVPSGRHVIWTWAVWVPVAVLCFYSSWGYATSSVGTALAYRGLVVVLVLVGVGGLIRPAVTTRQWLLGVRRRR